MNKGLTAIFGDLTEEEEKAIRATTEELERSVLRFQKRSFYSDREQEEKKNYRKG